MLIPGIPGSPWGPGSPGGPRGPGIDVPGSPFLPGGPVTPRLPGGPGGPAGPGGPSCPAELLETELSMSNTDSDAFGDFFENLKRNKCDIISDIINSDPGLS